MTRFMSGAESEGDANVQCVPFSVDGKFVQILFTTKAVKKGTLLRWWYGDAMTDKHFTTTQ